MSEIVRLFRSNTKKFNQSFLRCGFIYLLTDNGLVFIDGISEGCLDCPISDADKDDVSSLKGQDVRMSYLQHA